MDKMLGDRKMSRNLSDRKMSSLSVRKPSHASDKSRRISLRPSISVIIKYYTRSDFLIRLKNK